MKKLTKQAFTLIEVLVAGSVLFIVSAAVVGLSNSIIQGTAVTTDAAVANRLATEGLEIITKIRDDQNKQASYESGRFIWFAPAESVDDYGWYRLEEAVANSNSWQLQHQTSLPNVLDTAAVGFDVAQAQPLPVGTINFYRLICVEAVAATDNQAEGVLNCNTRANTEQIVNDGDRQEAVITNNCFSEGPTQNQYREDLYCQFSKDSINRNKISTTKKIIPDGNAVRVRSVVIWNDRGDYRVAATATLFTNWQSVVN
ncbi:MAG: prepilin-type N-terminal cleavage/methylation domain-containing protein [Patescibacteria group bacterium]